MAVSQSKAGSISGLRVLIVEDEPLLAMCLGEVIEGEGGVIAGTAYSIAEAQTLVAAAEFDVAVLDLNLHGQPVGVIASAIIARGNRIIFSTGCSASAVPAEFAGWPVLSKPYSDVAVLAALAQADNRPALSLETDVAA